MTERKKISKRSVSSDVVEEIKEPEEAEKLLPVTKNYFSNSSEKKHDFISTGCEVLNEVLGGGYVLGRMSNIIGDKSSGKTLLAIEACANFARDYLDGEIHYIEAEAAFDEDYAEALGMPVDRVNFTQAVETIEDLFEFLEKTIDSLNEKPCLVVVDSLDGLSDRAELERKIGEGSYNMAKQKLLSQLFRRLKGKLEQSRVCLLIISQIRDKIGVSFGETKTRGGGKSMDFYASHCLWLSEVGKVEKTINGIKRVIGIEIKAKCKKNKIGLPFRECQFPVLFGFGVDDLTANVEWLISVKRHERLKEVGLSEAGFKVRLNNLRNKGGEEVKELRDTLNKIVREEWACIETGFLPTAKKY